MLRFLFGRSGSSPERNANGVTVAPVQTKDRTVKIKEWLSLAVVTTALTACTDSDAIVAERESTLDIHGRHRLHLVFSVIGNAAFGSDPCVAVATETGTAADAGLGILAYSGSGIDNFCTRGQNEGDLTAIATLTAVNGDKLYAVFELPFTFDGVGVTWPRGTWRFLGGSGLYAHIVGSGTLPSGQIPNIALSATIPFEAEFDGFYKL
jgi:hypothetical protein